MLRATISSVAGTFSRSASRTALRPETISPFGFSLRPRGDDAARGEDVPPRFPSFFSAAFFRFAAA